LCPLAVEAFVDIVMTPSLGITAHEGEKQRTKVTLHHGLAACKSNGGKLRMVEARHVKAGDCLRTAYGEVRQIKSHASYRLP
jgi:16S rRNA G1207 methylase RsmC